MRQLPRTLKNCVLLFLATVMYTAGARAAVDLRVEARPIDDPIEAFVEVTDDNGDPVTGLTADDFSVLLDGAELSLSAENFSPPASEDPNAKVSVIFVMDYSGSTSGNARIAVDNSVIAFVNAMNAGDYAAIIKFNSTNPAKASVVREFTAIDDGGSGDSALIGGVMEPYEGVGTNLLDAVDLAVDHYNASKESVPLPPGPKAVIVISDGGENQSATSREAVVIAANEASLPVFTIGVGNFAVADVTGLLQFLPAETGGRFIEAPTEEAIAGAYVTISQLLDNEYLLTFESDITDCDDHTLSVSVTGQAAPEAESFSRCSPEPVSLGGGGGGGAFGILEIASVCSILALRRRRHGLGGHRSDK